MLLLNINRKAYMRNLMMCLHFTLVTLKDQCQGHSILKTYISWVFNIVSLQEIAICHTNCRCQAEHQGPWTSCLFSHVTFKKYMLSYHLSEWDTSRWAVFCHASFQSEILHLSEQYVRQLASETQNTIDGPYAGRLTGYGGSDASVVFSFLLGKSG